MITSRCLIFCFLIISIVKVMKIVFNEQIVKFLECSLNSVVVIYESSMDLSACMVNQDSYIMIETIQEHFR